MVPVYFYFNVMNGWLLAVDRGLWTVDCFLKPLLVAE